MLIEWLIHFGPISTFFLAFKLSGDNFFVATIVLMVGIVLATFMSLLRDHRLPWFPLYTAIFTLLFGGTTLYFHDPSFLMARDTFYDGIFGLIILGALALNTNILKTFFMPLFALTEHGWQVLAWRWAFFFLTMATLNEIIRHLVIVEHWVYFKLASTVTFILFGLSQLMLTHRERIPSESDTLGLRHYF